MKLARFRGWKWPEWLDLARKLNRIRGVQSSSEPKALAWVTNLFLTAVKVIDGLTGSQVTISF